VDASVPVTIVVEQLGATDLHGAMLRKSFSRGPNRALYWPPARSLIAALLTAGLLPTGFLLWRLWLYASHHKFRAVELAAWMRAPGPPQFGDRIHGHLSASGPFNLRTIRPVPIFIVGALCWSGACALLVTIAANWVGLLDLVSRSHDLTVVLFAAMSMAASLAQLASVLSLRMRVHGYFARPDLKAIAYATADVDPNLPMWSLWPVLLSPLVIVAKLADSRVAALWIIAALVSALAAEVQRGYITVADRRLRYAIARQIGALMRERAAYAQRID
jgi:hypothetical protein